MRIAAFALHNQDGLTKVEASGLSDVIVIAGPNGVGKTRLVNALIRFFRSPDPSSGLKLTIEATSSLERKAWGKSVITTENSDDASALKRTLQRNQKRSNYKSTVLNFDSDRAIINIKPYAFAWDITDPFEEDVGWDLTYRMLRDRFQDVQHSLFKIVESQRRKIAETAVKLRDQGRESMLLDFPDPLTRFKDAFYQLLAPKKFIEVDVKNQQIIYEFEGDKRPFSTLSSGEKEVINIVFDFLLRNPSDCIIVFDEPELHLHPELSYKLLQTLSSIGNNNQFIFCTHSPEIITASIENSVIFLTPPKPDAENQALMVSRDDSTHHALNLLGQSIGIISLGKKLLIIEGEEASLDKQTYGAILKNEFPELVLVPVGGKRSIKSFDEVRESVLNKTIWGVEFFMLCDRDAVYEIGVRSVASHVSDRLKVLPRYHLENYFLEENILAAVFADMESDHSWLRSPDRIHEELLKIARDAIPLCVALKVAAVLRENVGNIDVMPKAIHNATLDELISAFQKRAEAEVSRVSDDLDMAGIDALARTEYCALVESIENDTALWKHEIPGRIIVNKFASAANMKVGRLKTMYLKCAQDSGPDPFLEIRELFRSFRKGLGSEAEATIGTVAVELIRT